MSESMDSVNDGSRGIPAIAPALQSTGGENPHDWSVKYYRANFAEVSDVLELQAIETRAARNEGVIVQSKKTYTNNDEFFIVICYWERNL